MARARNIKPSFFQNEHLAETSPHARLLFIGLWCIADREGRLEDRPKRIKANLFPYEEVDTDALLNELASSRGKFILRYKTPDNCYIQVVNFCKHQHPHIKEGLSTIPAPDLSDTSTIPAPDIIKTDYDNKETTKEDMINTILAPDKNHTSPSDSLLPITDSPLLIAENGKKKTTTEKQQNIHKTETFEEYIETTLKPLFPNLDLKLQLEKFNTYWSENSKKLKNPKTAFRNWCEREIKYQENHNNGKKPTATTDPNYYKKGKYGKVVQS